MIYILRIVLLIIVVTQSIVFPPPLSHNLSSESFLLIQNPCSLLLTSHSKFNTQYYFNKIIQRLNIDRQCTKSQESLSKESTVQIQLIQNTNIKSQGYQLKINPQSITIQCSSYSGYIYALQSLYQLIVDDFKVPIGIITDQPILNHRGLLVDTSRHYLRVQTLKRLITTMPLAKLNILHLHMVDNQAFSFDSNSHPQIPKAGSYSPNEVYTHDQIRQLINLGKINGVQIIPEIQNPSHVKSWSESDLWKQRNITIECDKYNHQLDITLDSTLTLIKEVIHQIDYLFKDSPYIHLGGDSVNEQCWNLRAKSFQLYKKLHNLKTFEDILLFWRYEIKQAIVSTRKVIFYQEYIPIRTNPEDIIQYVGHQDKTQQSLNSTQSKIILSPRDILSLSAGYGNIFSQNGNPNYINWRTIYQDFQIFPKGIDKKRIWGAEATVWSPMLNDDTFQNIVWMRAAVFGARVWSQAILPTNEIVGSIVKIQDSIYRLNIQASPITSEYCEINPGVCFPPQTHQIQIATE